jgi:hypothetical protein
MTSLEAHARFCLQQDAGDVQRWPLAERYHDCGPLLMTGLCLLAGGLDEAETDADLLELANEGMALLDSGIVADDAWADEMLAFVDELHALTGEPV